MADRRSTPLTRRRGLALLAIACAPTALVLGASPALAAPVGSGDLVVYRVGDGTAPLSSAATAVFLDEFTPVGAPVQTIALPTTGAGNQRRLTDSGSATSDGLLTRSADGAGLLLTGYDATLGTASVTGTSAASTNRVVGLLTPDGNVDTSTALTDQPSGNNVRSAAGATATLPGAGTSGSAVAVTGGTGFLRGTTLGAQGTSSQLTTDTANLRQAEAVDGKTFVSSSSGSLRLGYVNGSTVTPLPGFPTTGSPYSFALLDEVPGVGYAGGTVDTLYVADDTSTTGGVSKYSFDGTTFVAKGTIVLANARGLAAKATATGAQLYVTTAGTTSTLVALTDTTGSTGTLTATPTTVSTAPTNEAYRGVAFAPVAAPGTPPSVMPEVPLAAALPLLGLGAFGVATSVRRRRATRAAVATA